MRQCGGVRGKCVELAARRWARRWARRGGAWWVRWWVRGVGALASVMSAATACAAAITAADAAAVARRSQRCVYDSGRGEAVRGKKSAAADGEKAMACGEG